MTMAMSGPDRLAALRRGDLAGARELRLAADLAEFPPEILGLADTLEILDLSDNRLSALPAEFGRLRRLRVLFCSGNRFARLPPCLGDCPALSQVGFRAAGLSEVPAESLPPRLRWLTLTDNRLAALPRALGARPQLTKLMLSGNALEALPDTLADATGLELLRLSSNRLTALPAWLADLPRLAWVAWSGNPCEPGAGATAAPTVPWTALCPGEILGEGASGVVRRALWRRPGAADLPVALKLFKGAMTSDGLPEHEMAASLAAGAHPHLTGALGQVAGHPDGAWGLLLRLLPPDWRPLAGPPSLATCSRDVYDPALALAPEAALRIACGVAAGAAHLQARGILHGDLYAHNVLWDGGPGHAVLSDLGAASRLPAGREGERLRRTEVLALGILLDELLARVAGPPSPEMSALAQACLASDPAARPSLPEAAALLDGLAPRDGARP
ncbi:leucine-rich repeat-containing protein kinase family protein [Methylobacterium sp. JK268]